MEAIGLMPSSTAKAGGKRTGDRMSDYVITGGLFERVCAELLADGVSLEWQSREWKARNGEQKRKSKVKYTCPVCGLNAWAKPGVNLLCGEGMEKMIAENEEE